MPNYTTKLVDRTSGTSPDLLKAIQADAQSLFDEVFAGTNLQVAVSWGTANENDNYVVHFVEDKTPANSYLLKRWPNATIDPAAIGHTHSSGSTSGSEVYKFTDAGRTQSRGMAYAKTVLHELFHNQFPFVKDDVHGPWGGGGLAASVAVLFAPPNRINQRNKELIRRGLSVKTPQLI